MRDFERQYEDVLQNIEFGIIATYREHPEMADYAVMRVLEALIDGYRGEKIGRSPREFGLSDAERLMMGAVRDMCEWRLGRKSPAADTEIAGEGKPQPKTVDEIILCLKRVLKSVNFWNKEAGRKGYLNYVSQFVM
jgi:hypothetical protein